MNSKISKLPSSNSAAIEELLTVKELEGLLKIDQKTIYNYVSRGLIPYIKIQSNIRFSKKRIAEWIEEQSFSPQSSMHY